MARGSIHEVLSQAIEANDGEAAGQALRVLDPLDWIGVTHRALSGQEFALSGRAWFMAAQCGADKVIAAMIRRGADLECEDRECDSMTALQEAASRGYAGVVRVLVAAGAELNRPHRRTGRTAVEYARAGMWCRPEHSAAVREVLRAAGAVTAAGARKG